MKAMIFAAGKGTRLLPLTHNKPKALVKVNGIQILERLIIKLKQVGVSEIIINVHYFANQIIDFLKSKNNFDIHIEFSDETDELLDTGGGLKKASHFFNDGKPFILYNTDIISDIDLTQMLEIHNKENALSTIAVRDRKSSRYFLFNSKNELCGWKNEKTNKQIICRSNNNNLIKLAFSGIHILNPEIFNLMNSTGAFSIVDTYLNIASKNRIIAYKHTNDYWFDIGDVNKLEIAEQYLNQNNL